MSKVDPESVNKLERKSTMLINAPREEEEKITGLDQRELNVRESRRAALLTDHSRLRHQLAWTPCDPASVHLVCRRAFFRKKCFAHKTRDSGSIMRARSRRGSTATNRSRQASGFDPRDPFSLHNLPRYQLSDLPSGPNVRENSAHGSYSAAESRADDDILAPVRANTSIRL